MAGFRLAAARRDPIGASRRVRLGSFTASLRRAVPTPGGMTLHLCGALLIFCVMSLRLCDSPLILCVMQLILCDFQPTL